MNIVEPLKEELAIHLGQLLGKRDTGSEREEEDGELLHWPTFPDQREFEKYLAYFVLINFSRSAPVIQ